MNCSPMDPLQWMGAFRMRIEAADKAWLQSINNILWNEELVFCKKPTSPRHLTLKHLLANRSQSITFPPVEKSIPCCTHIKIHWHIWLKLFSLVNAAWSVHISWFRQGLYFSRNFKLSLWICYKHSVSFTTLTDGLELGGLFVIFF